MRSILRTFASAAVLTALVLGIGASTVVAGSTLASAMSSAGYEFTDEWCSDDRGTRECTYVNAMLVVTSGPDGREKSQVTLRQTRTSHAADGTQIGPGRTSSFSRTGFTDGGRDLSLSVNLTDGVGDRSDCGSTYLVRVVGYELLVERRPAPRC